MAASRKAIRISEPPDGFRYHEDFITHEEETALAREIEKLPLKEFEFHGYLGKRRVQSFGWHYDFGEASLRPVGRIPDFLLSLRERAAAFADLHPDDFSHVLVTEYSAGTPIGWHRDKLVFDRIVGVSLLSPCTLRLRRKTAPGWERYSLILQPRSSYLLSGRVRNLWEHSIPPVDSLRYSVTFRSLRLSHIDGTIADQNS